uniref:CRC domain-containing protein n=1 Tax=Anopheles farauti TaxID=69004 RepID=A0A182QGV9_9DIPT
MENFRDIDNESYDGSEDLVEYTAEELEEEEEVNHNNINIELEDLVDESSQPGESTEEEYYDDDDTSATIQMAESGKKAQSIKHTPIISRVNKVNSTSGSDSAAQNVVMIPQSTSTSGTTMKLLNSSRISLPQTMATASYRLINSDGTMITNVRNKPSPVKKVISMSSPSTSQQCPAKVVLNANARVMHIQPQSVPSSSGTALKTMALGKTITMKTIPGGAIKMVPQATPISSGGPGTVLRMTKPPQTQGVAVAGSSKITKINHGNGANELSKVVIKPNVSNTTVKKIVTPNSSAPLHAVTLPGGKGVQYVRLLNQRATSVGGTVQKFVMQSGSKGSNSNTITATNNTNSGSGSASISSGTPQGGAPKIVMQNNRPYVVRNGAGNMATVSTATGIGKSSVLPSNRKIILNADNMFSKDIISPGTRFVITQEDGKEIRTVVPKSEPTSSSKELSDFNTEDRTQVTETENSGQINKGRSSGVNVKLVDVSDDTSQLPPSNVSYSLPDEAYKKRACNCTKSQCLKLYCDCFANGECCYNCNCKDCFNTHNHDFERQKAIRSTLERNPNAFKPKIGSVGSTDDGTRLHTKGCNCKRSGCLKNYCECYEGKIACSSNCKCIGCRNTEQFNSEYDYLSSNDVSRRSIDDGNTSRNNASILSTNPELSSEARRSNSYVIGVKRPAAETDWSKLPPAKQPHHFMTLDVIEATVQCMVAQAEECLKRGCSMRTSERLILEEYGRCLLEIKDFGLNSEN